MQMNATHEPPPLLSSSWFGGFLHFPSPLLSPFDQGVSETHISDPPPRMPSRDWVWFQFPPRIIGPFDPFLLLPPLFWGEKAWIGMSIQGVILGRRWFISLGMRGKLHNFLGLDLPPFNMVIKRSWVDPPWCTFTGRKARVAWLVVPPPLPGIIFHLEQMGPSRLSPKWEIKHNLSIHTFTRSREEGRRKDEGYEITFHLYGSVCVHKLSPWWKNVRRRRRGPGDKLIPIHLDGLDGFRGG